jgi:hypothetical protein
MDDVRSLPDTADPPQEPADRPSPVMVQYLEIKTANPDSLLFYRMGDFYELFFEDAEIASRALGIVLTKRGKHRPARPVFRRRETCIGRPLAHHAPRPRTTRRCRCGTSCGSVR